MMFTVGMVILMRMINIDGNDNTDNNDIHHDNNDDDDSKNTDNDNSIIILEIVTIQRSPFVVMLHVSLKLLFPIKMGQTSWQGVKPL